MSQKTRVLNFSDLNEEEKEQYIRFMIENNINFQEDDQDEQYVAKVKIRNNARNPPPKAKYVRDENVMQRGPRYTATSNAASVSIANNASFDKQQRKVSREKPAKSNINKTPFVLASNQNAKRGAVNSSAADYMSFRNTQEDTFYMEGTQEDQRNTSYLGESIDQRQETSSVNKSREFQRVSQYKSREDLNRSKSVNQVEKKLVFDEGTSFMTYEKTPTKKYSIADEYVVNCIEQYKSFAELTNLAETGSQGRPKKLSSDHLSKQIEEIFSSRFIKETTALKSNMSKGFDSRKEDTKLNKKLNSFPYFVYEFLKERNKFTKAFEQAAMSLAYSTILTKRKSYEAEIFSKFLSEEFDTEDLTFFLFVRSIVEKELALVLANKITASTAGILLTQKNCYKVLESVYGSEEKTLVNRVFKKVKDHIEWEKEKKIDFGSGKIHLYSFLKITLEDYHITRKNIQATLQCQNEKLVNTAAKAETINTTMQLERDYNRTLDLSTSKAEVTNKDESHMEESRADADDIDHYLFGKPRGSANTGGDSNKALHDITNQGAQNAQDVNVPTGMFSNIHSYYYNNANSRHRNSLTDQSQEFTTFETQDVPGIMTVPTHSSNQSVNTSKVFNNAAMPPRQTPSLTSQNSKALSRSSSNLTSSTKEGYSNNTQKSSATGLPRAMTSSHQNLQSVPSLNSSTSGNRNSYSNIHRRNSGSLKSLPNTQTKTQQSSKVPSTGDLSSGFNSNTHLNSQANLPSQNTISVPEDIKETINTTGNFDSFSPMERTNTRDIDASLAKNTLPTIINYTSIDKSMMDNFSFRNWESQKQDLLNESELPEKGDETMPVVQPKTESVPESSRSFDRSFNQGDNEKSSKLQDYCLVFMMHKVHEFIETMLFEGQEQRSTEEEKVKAGLLDLFERKFRSLIKALFSFDKLKWLNSLMIDDPSAKQLQIIEDLQKDLRALQKRSFDELNEEDIEIFANKIFRTPELSTQIGRLIVEFTLPQDLLYGDDVAE